MTKRDAKKVVIIGGGIAGLCAAVYARRCGYEAEVLEMHDMAGGLATSWRRGGYTFETCLHWLFGSNPLGPMHARWQEVCDLDRLTFVRHHKFGRVETEDGRGLDVFTNVDRMEAEMVKHAPQDEAAIRKLAADIRRFERFKLPDLAANWWVGVRAMMSDVPYLGLLRELSGMTAAEYGGRFTDPLLRAFFGEGELGKLSAVALFFSLAWMNQGDADYAVGGAQALIRLIEEKLESLGGQVRFGARVERILVAGDTAAGVELEDGETIAADWVISAADGHATVYDLLEGRYVDAATHGRYEESATFPSYLQVSLGVAKDLSGEAPMVTRVLRAPFAVDPGTELRQLTFRIFNFDPTFAPPGKTAVTCFLPTRNHEYWTKLHDEDPTWYRAEKQRVAEQAIAVLEKRMPGIREAIEVVDVSSPATVIRTTGNWKGSMEGWFIGAGTRFRRLPRTLPGLRRFMMVGQWVSPGGGLPCGPMTARPAIKAMCREDGVPFTPGRPDGPGLTEEMEMAEHAHR